jgi:hypothetical protein
MSKNHSIQRHSRIFHSLPDRAYVMRYDCVEGKRPSGQFSSLRCSSKRHDNTCSMMRGTDYKLVKGQLGIFLLGARSAQILEKWVVKNCPF